MFPTIAKSRSQVKMSLRDYPESDQECIFMSLDTYPELFAYRFPETIFKSEYKEWRLTKRGDSKFLLFKDRGAKAVIGLVCVKSFKDTDNQ